MQAKGFFEEKERLGQGTPPGAPADGPQVTLAGRQISLPRYVASEGEAEVMAEVYKAVKAWVPEPIWTKLMAQYEQYRHDFFGRRIGRDWGEHATTTLVPKGANVVVQDDQRRVGHLG